MKEDALKYMGTEPLPGDVPATDALGDVPATVQLAPAGMDVGLVRWILKNPDISDAKKVAILKILV